jgi:D-alanyl-D-alanine carboxypeptidase (penicillin-binding protein 5/6)
MDQVDPEDVADEAPSQGEADAPGTTIHLGTHRRPQTAEHGIGDPTPISKTASGLSALGRAQARAQAMHEQPGGPASPEASPRQPSNPPRQPGRSGPGLRRQAALPALPALPRRRRGGARSQRSQRSLRRGQLRSPLSPRGSRRRSPLSPRGSRWRSPLSPRSSHRPGRLGRVLVRLFAAGVVVVVLAGVFVVVQLLRVVPRPLLRTTTPAAVTVRAPVPVLAWPSSGESAAAVVGIGVVGSAGPTTPVPIASLAKVMTALVVLHDHPLTVGQSGPPIIITQADQATYGAEEAAGDSVVPVVAGESLSELQLLEGLLIPSADNLAPVVAQWDAGSQAAFVVKMNAMAAALGMRATNYADAGGVSSSTVSTAADQLRLAEAAAANPVLMSIVRQPQLSLPGGLALSNYDTLLGQDGVVGIKTGSTFAAGGCFMFAADGTVSGQHVQVVGVVLGQGGASLITSALNASRALIASVFAALHPITALPAGTPVAEISRPWGPPVSVITSRAVTTLYFGQMTVRHVVNTDRGPIPRPLAAGAQVATATVTAGDYVETVSAVTAHPTQGPSLRWRLERL